MEIRYQGYNESWSKMFGSAKHAVVDYSLTKLVPFAGAITL